jgi:hypothetical protein
MGASLLLRAGVLGSLITLTFITRPESARVQLCELLVLVCGLVDWRTKRTR